VSGVLQGQAEKVKKGGDASACEHAIRMSFTMQGMDRGVAGQDGDEKRRDGSQEHKMCTLE